MEQRLDAVTVLAVDDRRDSLEMYAEWLPDGYEVRRATGGEAALEKLDDEVDVVLLDREMPDLPGEAVLAEIRDREPDPRVAMVTGVDPDVDVVEMGFDDYLLKPVSGEQLRRTVARLVRRLEYDETLRELYALCSKRAVLQVERTDAELAESEEFQRLSRRIEELRVEVDRRVDRFADVDFRATFWDLSERAGEE